MRNRKRWILVMVALASVLVIAGSSAVIFAQEAKGEDADGNSQEDPEQAGSGPHRLETLRLWHNRAHNRSRPLEQYLKNSVDQDLLLAEALNISVDELQEARLEARSAALLLAVEEGIIDQEQADHILAFMAISKAINRGDLIAEALGISVDQLREAHIEGKHLPALLDEQDLTLEEFRQKLVDVFQEAVEQAVADGAISQDQADLITDELEPFLGRFLSRFLERVHRDIHSR